MAEPISVPVVAEFVEVDTSKLNFNDAAKEISKSMTGISKSLAQTFSKIDPTRATKPLLTGIKSVENSFLKLNSAHSAFSKETAKVGKSTDSYKKLATQLDAAKARLASLETIRMNWENDEGDFIGTPAMWEDYLTACEKYELQLGKVQELQAKLNDPSAFVKDADPLSQATVESSLRKLISVYANFTQEYQKFEQTAKNDAISDEYKELVKQAEAHKQKLDDIDKKSKKMEALGATDKQWEAIKYDTAETSSEMDGIIRKMRAMVKSGEAFRNGTTEGNEGLVAEMTAQNKSLSGSRAARKKGITERANKNQSPYTEDYQKALDDLDKLETKVKAIKEKSAKMIELGASKKEFANTAYDADKLKSEVEAAKNRITEMVNEGKAFRFGKGDAAGEINKVSQKSQGLEKELEDVAKDSTNARQKLLKFKEAHPTLAKILKVATGIGLGFAKVGQGVGKAASVLGKGIKSMGLFGKAGSKTSGDLSKKFKKLSRNIMMFGLGFRTAYYAVKRLRNIFIEGFKAMGEQFDEIGNPMTTMMESFDRLKNSLATVLQPIATILMPIVTTLMNSLTGVMEKIAEFTAVLSGQKYIYKAVAKDINSVADASKNANKQLGSYDKLEVISNNDTGQEYTQLAVGDAETASSNFAKMVKDAWEKADFTSVGAFISKKLAEVLNHAATNMVPHAMAFANKILTSINTFLLGFDATSVGSAMSNILNAVVTGLDWSQLGSLFANWTNTVWGFLDGLVNGINWSVLGQSINTGLKSLVTNLDFDKIANTISGLVMGLIDVVTSIDWNYIANKLFTGIMKILTTVGTKMSNSDNPLVSAFGGAVLAISEALNNLKPAIETIIQAFGPIITAILPVISALLPPISAIISTLVTDLLPPIVRLIEAVMPLLVNIIEIIMPVLQREMSKISSVIGIVIDIITVLVGAINLVMGTANVLTKVFRGEFDSFKDIWDALLDAWRPAINSILAGVEGMANGVITALNKMIGGLNKISFDIPDWGIFGDLAGKKFGLNIGTIGKVSIPRLAQGAVIPPNQEFLAVLGDQKRGTNIEAPLDTIKQALAEVLAETSGGAKDPIVLRLNGRDIAKVVWDEEDKRYKQTGRYATI